MAEFPIAAGLEVLKLLLQAIFQFAKVTGMSAEELEKAYQEEYQKFTENDPDALPDV